MIEVQSGPCLGEDDSVRIEDLYGHTEKGQSQNAQLVDGSLNSQ
jgi:hypothetical protein